MLLQRLKELIERNAGIQPPPMYQPQPICYVIHLDEQGRVLGNVLDLGDPSDKRSRRGKEMIAPHVKRANGIKPKLLVDTGVYVLGLPTEKDRPARVVQQREAFRALVEACANETGERSVLTVAAFLGALDPADLPLPDGFDPSQNMTFRVGEIIPFDLPAVRTFWAVYTGAGDGLPEGGEAQMPQRRWLPCVICGQRRAALQRHPIKIKGIPGGQPSGTDLISANDDAFESYGLKNSLIAPTCGPCAEAYANALNRLLADPGTCIKSDAMAHVFWTATPVEFEPARMFSDPDPQLVKELLTAAQSGSRGVLAGDDTGLYALGLSAAVARTVVRSWLDTTVGEAKRRLTRWFALQQMVTERGEPGDPIPLRRLAEATVRLSPRKRPLSTRERPSPRTVDALVAFALAGTPLPDDLLFDAVRRCRADLGVTRERAALIRLTLGSQLGVREGRTELMPDLDLTNSDPAYLCGRLFAKLDALQRRALGKRNATVVDRFYGSASTAPATVFSLLLGNAQHHFAKLHKDPKTQAAGYAIETDVQEIVAGLKVFPRTLTLPQQGLFALGFYHQRASDARDARERREGGNAADDHPDDDDDGPAA